jgi:hypothetical protein
MLVRTGKIVVRVVLPALLSLLMLTERAHAQRRGTQYSGRQMSLGSQCGGQQSQLQSASQNQLSTLRQAQLSALQPQSAQLSLIQPQVQQLIAAQQQQLTALQQQLAAIQQQQQLNAWQQQQLNAWQRQLDGLQRKLNVVQGQNEQ